MWARAPSAPRTVPGGLTRPAAARCVNRASELGPAVPGRASARRGGERARAGERGGKEIGERRRGGWNRLVTERAWSGGEKPGTESARGDNRAPQSRPPGNLLRPSLLLAPNRGARRTRAAVRGQNPPRTLGTNPGRSGLGPPAAASSRRSIYTRGSGRTAGSWGGGLPARPLPLHAAPPPHPAHPAHLGLQDPLLRPGSAARYWVGGLAEGRASLREATSRPFLQCE